MPPPCIKQNSHKIGIRAIRYTKAIMMKGKLFLRVKLFLPSAAVALAMLIGKAQGLSANETAQLPTKCTFCPTGMPDADLLMPSDNGCSAAMARSETLYNEDDKCAELLGFQGMCCPDESDAAVQAIPIEILQEAGAVWKDGHGKNLIIVRGVSALVSIIASSILLWMIMKTRDRLSTTYHRVLLGMCVADLLFSVAQIHFSAMVPSEMDYISWNASGNLGSCTAQGFLDKAGYISGLLYSCSLNLYYLSKVKYNKSDSYVRTKIEPFLHGVPILTALTICITFAVKKNFNDIGQGACVDPAYDPPHCIGYEDGEVREGFNIPCGRGRGMEAFNLWSQVVIMYSPPLIIGISLGMMYRHVKKQEGANKRYGTGTLNVNSSQGHAEAAKDDVESRNTFKRSNTVSSIASTIKSRLSIQSVSSGQGSMSRAVMYRAQAYAAAYLVAWGWPSVAYPLFLSGVWTRESTPLGYLYVWYFFTPLQGLFTFLVYMQPKVMKIRKSSEGNISWCQSFAKAFSSGLSGGRSS